MRYTNKDTLCGYELDGKLVDVILKLQELVKEHGNETMIESEVTTGYKVSVPETEEREKREVEEKHDELKRRTRDYERYLDLLAR